MRVERHTDPKDFIAVSAEWDELLPQAVTDTIFLRHFWHSAWWQAYGAGKELRVLTVRDDGERLVGIAPLFHHQVLVPAEVDPLPRLSIERPMSWPDGTKMRMLHLIGGTEVSDYLDFIVARGSAPAVYEVLFRHLVEDMKDWDLLDLHCLPAGSPLLTWFPNLAQARGYRVALAREEVCPIVNLPSTWEEYLLSLTGKQRHELRRKVRRAEREANISWRKTEHAGSLAEDLEVFFLLHERSDPGKEAFWDERTRHFFRLMAEAAQKGGWLQLSFVYFDGKPAGSFLCFDYKEDCLVYNSGYDPSFYQLSPGLVLLSYVIEDAIARGCKRFDFLRGDERYKYDFGGVDMPIYRLTIAPS